MTAEAWDSLALELPRADELIDRSSVEWVARGWTEAAGGMSLVLELWSTHQALTARIAGVLTPMGLTHARYEVLMSLLFSGEEFIKMARVAERLQVHSTSVTNAVQKLERDGYIVRRGDPRDRRISALSLTAAGRELAHRATVALNAEVFGNLCLEPTQEQHLFRLLRSFRRNAGDF